MDMNFLFVLREIVSRSVYFNDSSEECIFLVASFFPSFFLMLRVLNSDLSTDYTDGH